MQRSSAISLASTLIIHGFLLCLLGLNKQHSTKIQSSNYIDLILREQKPFPQKKSISPTKMKHNKLVHKDNLFKKLSPSQYYLPSFHEKYLHSKNLEGDSLETLNQMSLTEYSSNNTFFSNLLQRFDQQAQYPQELIEHNIQGKVNISVLINYKGELLQVLSSSSLNPSLKAYLIVSIYQALSQPLPKKHWYNIKRNITLTLNFNYQILTLNTQQNRFKSSYYKNHFNFLRTKNGPNLIQEFVEQNARYIPPVIPIPGGFFIDFIQAYRMITAWDELDPKIRKKQKLQLTRSKLEKMMKTAKENHLRSD